MDYVISESPTLKVTLTNSTTKPTTVQVTQVRRTTVKGAKKSRPLDVFELIYHGQMKFHKAVHDAYPSTPEYPFSIQDLTTTTDKHFTDEFFDRNMFTHDPNILRQASATHNHLGENVKRREQSGFDFILRQGAYGDSNRHTESTTVMKETNNTDSGGLFPNRNVIPRQDQQGRYPYGHNQNNKTTLNADTLHVSYENHDSSVVLNMKKYNKTQEVHPNQTFPEITLPKQLSKNADVRNAEQVQSITRPNAQMPSIFRSGTDSVPENKKQVVDIYDSIPGWYDVTNPHSNEVTAQITTSRKTTVEEIVPIVTTTVTAEINATNVTDTDPPGDYVFTSIGDDTGTTTADPEPPEVQEAKANMKRHKLGHFTGFLVHLLRIIRDKDPEHSKKLFLAFQEEVDTTVKNGELTLMGSPAPMALQKLANLLVTWKSDKIKNVTEKAIIIITDKNTELHENINHLLKILDSIYTAKESEYLLQTLQYISDYPDNNSSSHDVINILKKNVMSIYARLTGTGLHIYFIDALNAELLRRFQFRKSYDKPSIDRVSLDTNDSYKRAKKDQKSSKNRNDRKYSQYQNRFRNTKNNTNSDRSKKNKFKEVKEYNTYINVKESNFKQMKELFINKKNSDYYNPDEILNHRNKIYETKDILSKTNDSLSSGVANRNNLAKNNSLILKNIQDIDEKDGKGSRNTDKEIYRMTNQDLSPRKIKTPLRTLTKHRIKQHLKQKHPEIYYEFKKRRAIKKIEERKGKRKHFQPKTKPKRLDSLKENGYNYEKVLRNQILNYINKIDIEKIVNDKGKYLRTETEEETTTRKAQKRFNVVTASTSTIDQPNITTMQNNHGDVQKYVFNACKMGKDNRQCRAQKAISQHSDENTKSKYLKPVQFILANQEHRFRQMARISKENISQKKLKSKKNLLQNIVEESSYSDEEKELKWFLTDAMRHGDAVLKNFRRNNDFVKEEKRITDLSSYSDEEGVFKNNIYKAFGYNADLVNN